MSFENAFCKLGSDLVISYNGSLLECMPKDRSSLVGTVLTRSGQLASRSNRKVHWELLSTPSVYLFYDNDTNATFLVDTCKCNIKEYQPEGRILDCTDRVIYEIKCDSWVPVCDLSSQQTRSIVLCNSVPVNATTASFQFPGKEPIVEQFSEISACQVVFCDHTATVTFNPIGPGSLPPGGCAVLAFTVCCDNEIITIFKIFIRQSSAQRFSAQTATFGTAGTPGLNIPIQTCPLPAFPVFSPTSGPTGSAGGPTVVSVNWANLRYDRPVPSFNTTTGIFTAPVAGDYDINAVLTYNNNVNNGTAQAGGTTLVPIPPHLFLPRFVLVQNRTATSPGTIIFDAPVDALIEPVVTSEQGIGTSTAPTIIFTQSQTVFPPCGTNLTLTGQTIAIQYHLADQGQAVINIGCTLNVGDTLQILYIDDVNCYGGTTTPPTPISTVPPGFYTLDCLGTTFKATQIL